MSAQRLTRLGVAIFGSVISVALSWPYWRDFEYWAESQAMWRGYFVVGFLLAVYVFYVFLGATATMFKHDAIDRAKLAEEEAREAAKSQGGAS